MKKALFASALLFAFLLGACASTVPTSRAQAGKEEIREQDVSDARLEAEVRLALLEKLGNDGLDVKVDALGGRVRLSGAVDKRSTQELAEEVVRSVPGVQGVDNALVAREGSAGTPAARAVGEAENELGDAILEMRVGRNLLGEIGRYALDLEVEATGGVVSLRGMLPDEERKSLALRAARETSGVQRVVDLLKVQDRERGAPLLIHPKPIRSWRLSCPLQAGSENFLPPLPLLRSPNPSRSGATISAGAGAGRSTRSAI
jgi:osmotically-inducible protein OsmY